MDIAKLNYTHNVPPTQSGVDNEPEPLALRCTLLQNRAACRLQLKQYACCQQVLLVLRRSVGRSAGCIALRTTHPHTHGFSCRPILNTLNPTITLPKHQNQDCNEVLAFDKTRAKARYRRGVAYEGLGCYDDALKDLRAVVRYVYTCR